MSEMQYGLVHDGALVSDDSGTPIVTGFLPTAPDGYSAKYPSGCEWLPVRNVDTEQFVPGRHYRATPTFHVNGRTVERVYRVMLASR